MKKILWIGLLFAISCNTTNNNVRLPQVPYITPEPVTRNYWGTSVTDDYRNLENMEDSTVQKWYKSQGDHANAIFDRISGRDSLVYKMRLYDKEKEYYLSSVGASLDDQYFYLKIRADEEYKKLYYRASEHAEEELIYDPRDFRPESGKEYSINYIHPSWDGRYVVVAMSYEGREVSEMIVIDMQIRKPLPQVIDHCWPDSFGGVRWLPDSSGFVYLHFPNIDKNDKNYKKNTAAVLYKIGQDPKKLNVVLSAKNNPELNLDPGFFPMVDIHMNSNKYAIAYMINVGNYFDAYYANLEEISGGKKVNWKPLFTQEDKVYRSSAFIRDNEYIFISAKDAPDFQIAKVNLTDPDFDNPTILVPERPDEVIEDYVVTSDGLYR